MQCCYVSHLAASCSLTLWSCGGHAVTLTWDYHINKIVFWQELEKKDDEEEKSEDEKDKTKDKEGEDDDEAEEPEEYDEEEHEEVLFFWFLFTASQIAVIELCVGCQPNVPSFFEAEWEL